MPAPNRHRTTRPGLDRPQTQYAWPTSLVKPEGRRLLVYLDMNHWIYLAQAATGHENGTRYQKALDALRHAERVAIPLASVHYMEIERNRDANQRLDLARLMEELSGFVSVQPRSSIARVELDAALTQVFGTPSRFTNSPLLGWGVLQAFGRRGGLTVHTEEEGDVTARARQEWLGGPDAFDAWSRNAELELTRAVLRGPSGEEVADMRERGWDPTVARRIAEDRAQSERELASPIRSTGIGYETSSQRDIWRLSSLTHLRKPSTRTGLILPSSSTTSTPHVGSLIRCQAAIRGYRF